MGTTVTLEVIFQRVEEQVDGGKLKLLRRHFGDVVGQPVVDPMVLRRQLIARLRSADVPPGTVQALVQFYMGIIRRAALAKLIPPPPEGPWTRSWQSVLDLPEEMNGAKAHLRSLAGWATDKGLEPGQVTEDDLVAWVEDLKREQSAIKTVWAVLQKWASLPDPEVASDNERAERLRRKAAKGSVALD